MQIIEVNSARLEKEFINFNATVHQDNPNYIRPLDVEVKEVFDLTKNKSFKYGEAARWILVSNNETIGRIAAFTNSKYKNNGTEFPVGGIGYFDCINQQEAANVLFDTAATWLKSKGMKAMDGPINFGDRDKWWGLLEEGYDAPPIYGMAYHPPYYKELFNRYGFKNYYNQYYYAMRVKEQLDQRFPERHARFKAKPGYEARHISKKNIDKHAREFAHVYNLAWAQHGEAKSITVEQAIKLFRKMKPVIDERIIWFAYYKDEPIAMWINIPDLNEYFKFFNGKFGVWQKLKLLWMKKTGICRKFTGIAFGVVPKFQSLGIDSFMIYEAALLLQHRDWYDQYEMGWAGEWNPKMINVYKALGAHQSRRMVTYRYLFDPEIPFERHPILQ